MLPAHPTEDHPTAYSYIRFSSKKQAEGDSLRRQTELAARYCEREDLSLDTTLTLRDMGVSAFRGKNALVGNLGVFLECIRRGTVRPGSVLIVESLDRISRQGIDEGYDLVKRILKAGVWLVTLAPERKFGPDAVKGLTKGALEIQLILERAAEESEMKAERMREVWGEKQDQARKGKPMTEQLPAWVEWVGYELVKVRGQDVKVGGRLVLHPERAALVKRIFALAAAGRGIPTIMKTLTEEGIPPMSGLAKHWNRSYLGSILRDRRALGEYQPTKGKVPDGPPIPGYYPAVVTQEEWDLARAGVEQRTKYKGRVSPAEINIFAGLLTNALDGESYIMTQRTNPIAGKMVKYPVLINSSLEGGRAPARSFPYREFETAILSCLREISPAEILNGDVPPDNTVALTADLARLDARIASIEKELESGDVAALARVLRNLEARRNEVAAELLDARQKEAAPLAEVWADAQHLAGVLASATDQRDARLRLRSALRRICKRMWLLVVKRGLTRLVAVQADFEPQGRRHWLIQHTQASTFGKRPVGWRVKSLADACPSAEDLDLARPADVEALKHLLEDIDLSALWDAMA
jgi:DNA invertase Pin-like site-specific DNA recombinase